MQKRVKAINRDQPEKQVTVARRIAVALKRHGVQYLFGQSNPPGVTVAADRLGIAQIGYRQETSGAAMADGFARVSGMGRLD